MLQSFKRLVLITAVLAATAAPAAADPITFSFSTFVTQAIGPIESLTGRTFTRGDTLAGQVTFDPGLIGPDIDSRPGNGQFPIAGAQIDLNVPSNFSVDSSTAESFEAFTENNAPGAGIDYVRFDALQPLQAPASGLQSVSLTWIGPGSVLSSTDVPLSTAGFDQFEFRLNATDAGGKPIVLYGDTAAPTPEPGTLLLLGGALAFGAILQRSRARRAGAD